jgi:hypothetical protein
MLYTKLKKLSKENKIPVYVIEEKLNLARGSICKWDNVNPSFDKVVGVSRILEVPIEELINP